MQVDPEQIIVGAGTELLYHLLIQLLGRDKCYAVEDPGYSKIAAIYESNQVQVQYVGIDEAGLSAARCAGIGSGGAYFTYPPLSHRHGDAHRPEAGAAAVGGGAAGAVYSGGRLRQRVPLCGRPIPTLYSTDENQRVVYLNTFSKTIAPSIRISYMILPPKLLERYREKLGFYACTVSGFEQYTLAKFLEQGYFERHLGRMRNRYRQKRDQVITAFLQGPFGGRVKITEPGRGAAFPGCGAADGLPDDDLQHRAAERG